MTLRAIHDFEVALLDPCLAMSRRGLRVDEERRAAMLAALQADRDPTIAELQRRVQPHLGPDVPRANLFREVWTCPCCRNGKAKRDSCWSCTGFDKKPTKKELKQALAAQEGRSFIFADDDLLLLPRCKVCSGDGQRITWTFNPGSDDQTSVVLYDLLKLPQRTTDGRRTVDEDALKSLLAHDQSGVVAGMLQVRKLGTIASILERIAPGPDGRIRTFYNPAGTETGRFSSAESFLAASTNLQNLPKKTALADDRFDVRRCIVPSPGCAFVEADLSQAEARVVAALCGDAFLLERWSNGGTFDVHRWTAAAIFNKREDDVTKAERHLGKVARHALNYGMQWATFQRNVNADADVTGVSVTAAEAKRIVAAYHRLHPALQSWWLCVGSSLDSSGTLSTCFGRRRTFYGRRSAGKHLDDVHKEAIAFEPQSTVADLLNRGMLRWFREHDGKIGDLVAQVHDAVLLEVPLARVKGAARLLKRCLEEPLTINGVTLTIPADVSWSADSWGAMEPVR